MGRTGKYLLVVVLSGLLTAFLAQTSFILPALAAGVSAQSEPTSLRVTDTKGNTVTLSFNNFGVTIDYTSYSFFYTPDEENGGLRIKQGEGTVTVSWEKLSRIEITKVTSTGAEGQMVMTAGTMQPVVLVPWSKGGLEGNTELGKFSINLDKVKTIEIIR